MKKFFSRGVDNNEISLIVAFMNKTRKKVVLLLLFCLFISNVPWNYIVVKGSETELMTKEEPFISENYDLSKVPLDFEVTEKRTENEKHFRKIDGTFEVGLYGHAVHFLESNMWKDIDNSLIDLGADYENKDNNFE
jgi:hypothetical protein